MRFHPGELEVQERVGVREEAAEVVGGIADFVPAGARDFLATRRMAVLGTVDAREGRAWASVVTGEPGFISVPDPHTIRVGSLPPAGDPLLENLDGTSASDDAASNLTRNPARNQNYAWDSRNMLTQVNGGTVAFNYDALGRRERMNAGGLTSYLHDGDAAVVASTPSALDNFLTDDGGEVLAFSQTAQQVTNTYVPLIDAMGSTLALVDGNGNLVNSYVYDPAGAPLQNGPLAYPYQYAGSEFDPQTGLYHVGSYYDPVLERLVSGASPTGAGGPNLAGGMGPVASSSGPGLTPSQAAINAG
jgi:predicted pyridoxine 5'-phosphate oxidase superfamily flavin-nucleotide-binding protein